MFKRRKPGNSTGFFIFSRSFFKSRKIPIIPLPYCHRTFTQRRGQDKPH
jgi:hypothetical protein